MAGMAATQVKAPSPLRRVWRKQSVRAGAMRDDVERRTMDWVKEVVIKWDLCPFAKLHLAKTRVVADEVAVKPEHIIELVKAEAKRLIEKPDTAKSTSKRNELGEAITSLLVFPNEPYLSDFNLFMQLVSLCEGAISNENDGLGYEGLLQIVPFHPSATFEAATGGDPADYTGRSPYPTLHLLREEDVSAAIDSWTRAGKSTESIPRRNEKFLRSLGLATVQRKLQTFQRDEE